MDRLKLIFTQYIVTTMLTCSTHKVIGATRSYNVALRIA